MNILIVHNYYKIPGGEDTVVNNESELLTKNGHSVYFYKRSNKEMEQYSLFKKLMVPINTIFSLKSYKDVLRIISQNKIDVIHVHNTVCLLSPSVYYAAFKKNIPVVQTIHNFRLLCPGAALCRNGKICEECIDKGLFHSIKYSCYRNSIANTFAVALMETIHKFVGTYSKLNYICLTEFNKRQLLRINKKKEYIDPQRVFVKPNFVLSQNNIMPYEKRKNQIIYAGRLDKTKGIHLLFEAWKSINEYELIVCGVGPEKEWCESFIIENRLKNVKMLGFMPNEKVMDIISESKALILPTQWYEGFPMVLVESFSCGTPVLGSDIGNVGDIIVEGKNGLHFKHDDVQDIIRTVKKLSDMVDSTYITSQMLYSSEANYKQLVNIYKKILGE